MITLQFSTRPTPGSAVIRWATWSWCSHVDLVLPDGRLLGAVPGGVSIRNPEPDITHARRYTVPGPNPETLRNTLTTQLGRPYDWPGIIGWGLRRNWQQPDAWFCSELIAWAFQQLDHPLLNANHLHRITPRDLLLSPHLKKWTIV